ncbi:MAG: pyridoxine 5'-phosphate synthase [Pirellulaceae bacterium]|nr:MAG: pyridoxine 5'-phosphate synthase [Pirellulaceae bacterium]
MLRLGVNIDHVATLRQARRTYEPDPVTAAAIAKLGGADVITVHLREDRRHIQDRDLRLLRQTVPYGLNLELSCAEEILDIAIEVCPDQATLVPERREEVTTEGGLDVVSDPDRIAQVVHRLQGAGIAVSLFIDPDEAQVRQAAALGVEAVELHTGAYALATGREAERELKRLLSAAAVCRDVGLHLHAGHGLTYDNVAPVARIPMMRELNIGHSIVSRAVFVGLQEAVAQMKHAMETALLQREMS